MNAVSLCYNRVQAEKVGASLKNPTLSTRFEDPAAIPYFFWDEPMGVAELRQRLRHASHPERVRLIGKILREARDTDVWGFLFERWRIEGLLAKSLPKNLGA
jgi:hypothetical protein